MNACWISLFSSLMMGVSAVEAAHYGAKWVAVWLAWVSGWAAGLGFATWCVARRRAAAWDKADKRGDWTTITVAERPDINAGDVLILDQQAGHGVKVTDVAKDLKDKKESV